MIANDKTRVRLRTSNFRRASAVVLGLLCFTAMACLLVNTATASSDIVVRSAITEIEHMRLEHRPTLFEDAERRVAELLKQFTDPQDQAEIWNELTKLYSNSGGHAKRTIECAKKTLELPIAPEKRVDLYRIWAEAETKSDPGKDRVALRRIVVPLYLQAVAEFRQLKLPPVEVYVNVAPGSPPPVGTRIRVIQALPGDTERTRTIRLLTMARDSCLAEIEKLYSLPPSAPDGELRALVMEKLNDPELADELQHEVAMAIADSKAQKVAAYRKAGLPVPDGQPAKHELPPPRDRGRLVLVLSSFLLILTVVLVARRWHASQRAGRT